MNWNKIDQSWKEFAECNGIELHYAERKLFHAVECKYKVNIKTDFEHSIFLGVLWKAQDGYNLNHTKISTKFECIKALKDIEIRQNGIKSIFRKKNYTDFEKEIAQDLKNLNGKHLLLKHNILNIKLNRILSTQSEFDEVTKFIEKIKKNVLE